jgi:hypothetical protein
MQIFYAKKWSIEDIPSGFVKLINLQKFESEKYQFHHEGATNKEPRRQFKFGNHNGESPPRGFHAQNMPNITSLELCQLGQCQEHIIFCELRANPQS